MRASGKAEKSGIRERWKQRGIKRGSEGTEGTVDYGSRSCESEGRTVVSQPRGGLFLDGHRFNAHWLLYLAIRRGSFGAYLKGEDREEHNGHPQSHLQLFQLWECLLPFSAFKVLGL